MWSKALAVATLASLVVGQSTTPLVTPKVEFEVKSPLRYHTRTAAGRTFVTYMQTDDAQGKLYELFPNNGTIKAYPDDKWNDPSQQDPNQHMLGVTAQRIGPDGHLYVLDSGIANFSQRLTVGPPAKLIQIDIDTNSVKKVWSLADVTRPRSYLSDFRFNGKVVYVPDAGGQAIIVLNLDSGKSRRVLDSTNSTSGHFPISAEGHILRGPGGSIQYSGVYFVEVNSLDKHLYFQPGSGGLHRIETRFLEAEGTDDGALEARVEPFALTVSTGGSALDAEGNIYSSDLDFQRIIKVSPSGQQTVIAQHPRFLHAQLWIDSNRKLYVTGTQVNRLGFFNGGKNLFEGPFQTLSLDIGVGPSPIDHA